MCVSKQTSAELAQLQYSACMQIPPLKTIFGIIKDWVGCDPFASVCSTTAALRRDGAGDGVGGPLSVEGPGVLSVSMFSASM